MIFKQIITYTLKYIYSFTFSRINETVKSETDEKPSHLVLFDYKQPQAAANVLRNKLFIFNSFGATEAWKNERNTLYRLKKEIVPSYVFQPITHPS